MNWINFIRYESHKKTPKKWVWLGCLYYVIWVILLVYFSHLWQSDIERSLNKTVLKAYYVEQSGHVAYLMIGFHLIMKSIDWMSEKKFYLEVMFGQTYVAFKFIQFLVETFWIVVLYFVAIQVIFMLAFFDNTFLGSLWIKLSMNACIFSGFVVLWMRIRTTYSMLFGLLLLVIHPNIQSIASVFVLVKYILPYNTGQWSTYLWWLTLSYYWLAFHLYLIKPK